MSVADTPTSVRERPRVQTRALARGGARRTRSEAVSSDGDRRRERTRNRGRVLVRRDTAVVGTARNEESRRLERGNSNRMGSRGTEHVIGSDELRQLQLEAGRLRPYGSRERNLWVLKHSHVVLYCTLDTIAALHLCFHLLIPFIQPRTPHRILAHLRRSLPSQLDCSVTLRLGHVVVRHRLRVCRHAPYVLDPRLPRTRQAATLAYPADMLTAGTPLVTNPARVPVAIEEERREGQGRSIEKKDEAKWSRPLRTRDLPLRRPLMKAEGLQWPPLPARAMQEAV